MVYKVFLKSSVLSPPLVVNYCSVQQIRLRAALRSIWWYS